MWIGVLWAGLRLAMWIANVGGKISPWPTRKVAENQALSDNIRQNRAYSRIYKQNQGRDFA